MKKLKKKQKNGFTLVELLAVIVILAIILVIAVPKVMSVIEDSKKATLESTAKMIASSAEKAKVQNTVLGKTETITCDSVAKINDADYEDCDIAFDNNTAKVTIKGSGKFNGLWVCKGTKTNATAQEESCTPVVNVVNFATDDWATIAAAIKQAEENKTEYPYNVGEEKTIDMGSLGIHTIRVANTTKCSDEWMKDVTKSQTACGFVLEFKDIITTHEMNGDPDNSTGSTNLGGWPASEMRKYLNDIDENDANDGVIYNALPDDLKSRIIDTYVISSYGPDSTSGVVENENTGVLESGNYWSNDKLYLLSTYEVWGSNPDGYDTTAIDTITRQLDYYEDYQGDGYTGVSTSNYAGAGKKSEDSVSSWWLRSANRNDSNYFYRVYNYGSFTSNYSYLSRGVSPSFRIG